MKYYAFILFIFLANCSPYLPSSPTENDEPTLIRVECKNEPLVVDQIVQVLRMFRYSDLEKESSGAFFFIKARYQKLSDIKAEEITDYVKRIVGVLDVSIVRDGSPIRNTNYQPPQ